MESEVPNVFVVQRQLSVTLPHNRQDDGMAIRRSNWVRIQKRLSSLTKPSNNLPVWYSILFGISGSCGVSIVPLAITKDLPSWVLPLYICMTVFSLIVAAILVWLDRKYSAFRNSLISEIQSDMKDIESMYSAEQDKTENHSQGSAATE